MRPVHPTLLTLLSVWTPLALAFGIAINHINDKPVQLVLALLYALAVLGIARLVNTRRA